MRERVAENVHVFTSELYAQVNAGVIAGPDWSVVIDTLAYRAQGCSSSKRARLRIPLF
jgi:hypothetical protein